MILRNQIAGHLAILITVSTYFLLCRFYQELLSAKVLVPFEGIIEGEKETQKNHKFTNFVAPGGINTIVKHFLHSSGVFLLATQGLVLSLTL